MRCTPWTGRFHPEGQRLGEFEEEFRAGEQYWRWDGRGPEDGSVGAGLCIVRLVTPWDNRTERLVRLQ